jgi:single-stranded-DNA-specific exonuclease
MQNFALHPVVADVLAQRGMTPEILPSFLQPRLRDLMPDPCVLVDMSRATNILADAIVDGSLVGVLGDYDVDGACSTALLVGYLASVGQSAPYVIPDRVVDGYGPNKPLIDQLLAQGIKCLVTVDCGTLSHEALAYAKSCGLLVVVIDHHAPAGTLPVVDALVNPKREDDLSGLEMLCAAGLVFLTLVALQRVLRDRNFFAQRSLPEPDLMLALDLVALATVADVMPLVGLNRAFVKQGLKVLRDPPRVGMRALMDVSGLLTIRSSPSLGFALGPRINAGGRIGHSAMGTRLLLARDSSQAVELATELDRLNRERQSLEAQALLEAEAIVPSQLDDGRAYLYVESPDWHQGLVGLVAGRLKSRYHRVVFAVSWQGERGTASARSIDAIDVGALVHEAVELGVLEKGGGHKAAAGLTLLSSKRDDFLAFLKQHPVLVSLQGAVQRDIFLDAQLDLKAVTPDLMASLEELSPFGPAHPEPCFLMPRLLLRGVSHTPQGHVRLQIASDQVARSSLMFFKPSEEAVETLRRWVGHRLDVAVTVSSYQGQPSLHMVDARLCSDESF